MNKAPGQAWRRLKQSRLPRRPLHSAQTLGSMQQHQARGHLQRKEAGKSAKRHGVFPGRAGFGLDPCSVIIPDSGRWSSEIWEQTAIWLGGPHSPTGMKRNPGKLLPSPLLRQHALRFSPLGLGTAVCHEVLKHLGTRLSSSAPLPSDELCCLPSSAGAKMQPEGGLQNPKGPINAYGH